MVPQVPQWTAVRLRAGAPAAPPSLLDALAMILHRYSPRIVIAPPDAVLAEVSASLRLFGGVRGIGARIAAALAAAGVDAQLALAPTGRGAWLLAGAQRPWRRRVLRLHHLRRALDDLPVAALPEAAARLDWLAGIGCRRLGELRRLPRAGLARRAGSALLVALDRAYGDLTETWSWHVPPLVFQARLDLPARVDEAPALAFAARRLLAQLAGWLAARQCAVRAYTLVLVHERGRAAIAPTRLSIALAGPARDPEQFGRLLLARLDVLVLTAPVVALALDADAVESWAAPSATLFPEPGGEAGGAGAFAALQALLRARLGDAALCVPAPLADHRPDRANHWQPAGARIATDGPAWTAQAVPLTRPVWLLDAPVRLRVRDGRPCHGTPLRLGPGPERIETGWWDDAPAIRDYWQAEDARGVRYWIYHAPREDAWYLHGLFG